MVYPELHFRPRLSVLSTDRVLALRYLTAEHAIKRISTDGPEARVPLQGKREWGANPQRPTPL